MKTIYNIENTINLDTNSCFNSEDTYSNFQEDLSKFKTHLCNSVRFGFSETFYKFGDGDYYFLTKQEVGSAKPGNRAISVSYDDINHLEFTEGAKMNDYYTCEIYPENRKMFKEVIGKTIH